MEVVTQSSEKLWDSSFALMFARKWCDARAGNPHKEALRLGVGDEKGLGKIPRPFLLFIHTHELSTNPNPQIISIMKKQVFACDVGVV
jgi:hypothetical protein